MYKLKQLSANERIDGVVQHTEYRLYFYNEQTGETLNIEVGRKLRNGSVVSWSMSIFGDPSSTKFSDVRHAFAYAQRHAKQKNKTTTP